MISPWPDLPIYIFNFLFCNILVGPLVVFYWQGTWRILDNFAYIENREIYFWITYFVGVIICFFSSFTQKYWIEHFVGTENWIFVPVSRWYTYISAFGGVHYWYGIWNLVDYYSGKTLSSAVSGILVGFTILGGARALRNLVGSPNNVSVDLDKEHYFKATTRFKSENVCSIKFALDVLLTVFFGGLVTLVWRGIWTVMDVLLFPNDPLRTMQYSLIIYISVEIFIFLVHIPIRKILTYLENKDALILKILFENFIVSIVVIGCVSCWRGIWLYLDHYFLAENKKLAAWTAHLIGYFGLTLSMVSTTLLQRGCALDGEPAFVERLNPRVIHTFRHYCSNFKEIQNENAVGSNSGTLQEDIRISSVTESVKLPHMDGSTK